MPKGCRPYLPEQDFLLPPSLREWLPEGHLAYYVSDMVDQLDLSAIHAVYEKELRGQPPYDPRMMTKVLVYGYCLGVCSSRRIQKRLQEDIGFKVLAAGNEPDFRTIADFRKNHLEALEGLFAQVLDLALASGAMKAGRVALDGTKVKANASKHKAMSYGRMKEKQKQIREEVKRILAEAEAVDEEEDRRYGNKRGDELPAELQRRETRLAKIKQAKKTLEERARQKAEAEGQSEEAAQQAQPEDKDQYHFTDPESRIMKSADGFVQAYNAQAAVLAGSGYCSEENLRCRKSAEQPEKKIEGHLATGKQKHGEFRQPCPRGPLPKAATRVDRMTRKLQTKAGRAVCALRKCVVEPVFGRNK